VKVRARVLLVDAGQSYTVRIRGRSTKNAIRRELNSESYERTVERIEAKKPGQCVYRVIFTHS
jgi:hypothetical protein